MTIRKANTHILTVNMRFEGTSEKRGHRYYYASDLASTSDTGGCMKNATASRVTSPTDNISNDDGSGGGGGSSESSVSHHRRKTFLMTNGSGLDKEENDVNLLTHYATRRTFLGDKTMDLKRNGGAISSLVPSILRDTKMMDKPNKNNASPIWHQLSWTRRWSSIGVNSSLYFVISASNHTNASSAERRTSDDLTSRRVGGRSTITESTTENGRFFLEKLCGRSLENERRNFLGELRVRRRIHALNGWPTSVTYITLIIALLMHLCGAEPTKKFEKCAVNYCKNSGQCFQDGTSKFCVCKPEYGGKQCERLISVDAIIVFDSAISSETISLLCKLFASLLIFTSATAFVGCCCCFRKHVESYQHWNRCRRLAKENRELNELNRRHTTRNARMLNTVHRLEWLTERAFTDVERNFNGRADDESVERAKRITGFNNNAFRTASTLLESGGKMAARREIRHELSHLRAELSATRGLPQSASTTTILVESEKLTDDSLDCGGTTIKISAKIGIEEAQQQLLNK